MKNKIDKAEVRFKSTPEYWNKESLGLKRNTVRKADTDDRFKLLRKWMCADIDKLVVGIQNTMTGDVFFRDVKDVSRFDDYYIISW